MKFYLFYQKVHLPWFHQGKDAGNVLVEGHPVESRALGIGYTRKEGNPTWLLGTVTILGPQGPGVVFSFLCHLPQKKKQKQKRGRANIVLP